MGCMPILHFNNEKVNQTGFYMIAESAQIADRIIDELKEVIDNGGDPNEVWVNYTDVNDADMKRIKYEIEKYYREA